MSEIRINSIFDQNKIFVIEMNSNSDLYLNTESVDPDQTVEGVSTMIYHPSGSDTYTNAHGMLAPLFFNDHAKINDFEFLPKEKEPDVATAKIASLIEKENDCATLKVFVTEAGYIGIQTMHTRRKAQCGPVVWIDGPTPLEQRNGKFDGLFECVKELGDKFNMETS